MLICILGVSVRVASDSEPASAMAESSKVKAAHYS
jgi:hypothetical protein